MVAEHSAEYIDIVVRAVHTHAEALLSQQLYSFMLCIYKYNTYQVVERTGLRQEERTSWNEQM